MKRIIVLVASLFVLIHLQAQIVSIRTSYATKAALNALDEDHPGDRYQVEADFVTSIGKQFNRNLGMPVWSVKANAGYTRFKKKTHDVPVLINEVEHVSTGLNFIKEITPRWYVIAMVGEGLHAAPNNVRGCSFFFTTTAFGVYRFNSGVHLGAGFVASEMYGVIPMLYLNWKSEGRLSLEADLLNVMLGYRFNEHFKLNILPYKYESVFSAIEHDGSQSRVFRTSNTASLVQPELKFGRSTLSLELGVSWGSRTIIRKKSLSGSYNSNRYLEMKCKDKGVQCAISYRWLLF